MHKVTNMNINVRGEEVLLTHCIKCKHQKDGSLNVECEVENANHIFFSLMLLT